MSAAVARSAARRSPRRPASRRGAQPPARRGPGLFATLAVIVAIAALVALGTWQLERKVWKEALLGRIAALRNAPPEPLNAVINRAGSGGAVDFVRVQARCDDLGQHALHLYGLRGEAAGWREITVCRLTAPPAMLATGAPRYRSVLVDLGFEDEPPTSAGRREPLSLPRRNAAIVGVLRTPELAPWYIAALGAAHAPPPPLGSAPDAPAPADEWMRRDVPAMAAALHAPDVAPFMLTLESPRAGPRLIPAALPTDVPNRHLEYALTWFGLALALAALYLAAWMRAPRRK